MWYKMGFTTSPTGDNIWSCTIKWIHGQSFPHKLQSPRHKQWKAQQQFIIRWKWYIWNWVCAEPGNMSKLHKHVAWISSHLPLLQGSLLLLPGKPSVSIYQGETKRQQDWWMDQLVRYVEDKNGCFCTTRNSRLALKDIGEETSSQRAEVPLVDLVSNLYGKRCSLR